MSNDNSMLKVKELLFGEEVELINQRFLKLDKQIDKYREKQELKRDKLDNDFSDQLEDLKSSLSTNTFKLESDVSKTEANLNELITTFDLRLTSEIDDFKKETVEHFQEIKQKLRLLKEEILKDLSKLDSKHSSAVAEVKKDYVSRELLGKMLEDMGQMLYAKTTIPKTTSKPNNNRTLN